MALGCRRHAADATHGSRFCPDERVQPSHAVELFFGGDGMSFGSGGFGGGGFGGPGRGPSLGDYHAFKSTRGDGNHPGGLRSGGDSGDGDSGNAGNLGCTLLVAVVSALFLGLMVALKGCIAG